MKLPVLAALAVAGLALHQMTTAQSPLWATTWAASAQGPYPSGNPSAQPNLSLAIPNPPAGARDQTFRLIVRPDLWGPAARVRLTNAFGTQPITFDDVFVGVQMSGAALVPGTNHPVTFGGARRVVVPAGTTRWSDPVALGVAAPGRSDVNGLVAPDVPDGTQGLQPLAPSGRKLAISLHVVGESGPMTWHAKALTTSYLSRPGSGSAGAREDEHAFPFTTTSWFFVDAVDMRTETGTKVIVVLGDSITDGTGSTLNGDDRWPDVLSRRLHAVYGDRVAVVNAGIGGNQIAGPAEYSPANPTAGGPSAASRLERDVLSLSGVSAVVWLEGINDLSRNANTPVERLRTVMTDVVRRIRARLPGVRVIGGTVISALGSTNAAHGSPEQDAERRKLNEFIRSSGLFDAVVDFDSATVDPATGALRPEFVPDSTTGGTGDRLHPNRAGYQAMGQAIDLSIFGLEQR